MIARLLLLLVALAASASAKNLKGATEEIPVAAPLDNVKGARVLQTLHKKSTAKKSHPILKKYIDDHEDAIKKAVADKAHGRRLEGSEDIDWDMAIKTGSMVVRHRPNSDCSGPVITSEVIGLDSCHAYNVTHSVQLALTKKNGNYYIGVFGFMSADCSGEPAYQYMDEGWEDRCAMNVWAMNENGPTMEGIIVTSKSPKQLLMEEESGFLLTNHREDDCSDDIQGYTLHRMDACRLEVDHPDSSEAPNQCIMSEDSTYTFVKFTSCKGKKAAFTAYSDAACSRPLYSSKLNLRDEGLWKCEAQEDDYYYGYADNCKPH
ncbi:hypothetical protein B484DRAFT_409996 [Ochromonadaceae sp. CCMP2298]|nr:hypothetical protein B484DRAFT_409996 [Ochromonadaceae sp. CCMP2298]